MKIEMDEMEYRVVGDGGEEGPETEYGEVAVLRVGSAVYYAVIDDPNETPLPVVVRVDTVTEMPTEHEDVDFYGGEPEVEEGEPEEGPVVEPGEEDEEDDDGEDDEEGEEDEP